MLVFQGLNKGITHICQKLQLVRSERPSCGGTEWNHSTSEPCITHWHQADCCSSSERPQAILLMTYLSSIGKRFRCTGRKTFKGRVGTVDGPFILRAPVWTGCFNLVDGKWNHTVTNTWPLWIFLIRLNSAKRKTRNLRFPLAKYV